MTIIGIPKEIKASEKRVALTPVDCKALVDNGLNIHIESTAGVGAGFEDADYIAAGCVIETTAEALYASAEIIVKVKEPLAGDLKHLRKHHTLFCYLHLASDAKLVETLKRIRLKAYAFETVVVDGQTPLLLPMSAIAGRLSIQIATYHLHAERGGNGTLLGGISHNSRGVVSVIGAGVAGTEAAILADGMGAKVRLLDVNKDRLNILKSILPRVEMVESTPESVANCLADTDVLIGAVYVVGKRAPIIVNKAHISSMKKGAVVVDISIDQGGCVETSRPCTHDAPTYEVGGIVHSAITNLPAAAPRTASEILSKAIAPYVEQLATGFISKPLKDAVNIEHGVLKIEL